MRTILTNLLLKSLRSSWRMTILSRNGIRTIKDEVTFTANCLKV